jgi:hypothetical protein
MPKRLLPKRFLPKRFLPKRLLLKMLLPKRLPPILLALLVAVAPAAARTRASVGGHEAPAGKSETQTEESDAQAERSDARAEKIKAKIAKLAGGKPRRAEFKLLNGVRFKGRVREARESDFVVYNEETRAEAVVSYAEVGRVKTNAPMGVRVGVAVAGVFGVILLAALIRKEIDER